MKEALRRLLQHGMGILVNTLKNLMERKETTSDINKATCNVNTWL
jgi:hypothetical protein